MQLPSPVLDFVLLALGIYKRSYRVRCVTKITASNSTGSKPFDCIISFSIASSNYVYNIPVNFTLRIGLYWCYTGCPEDRPWDSIIFPLSYHDLNVKYWAYLICVASQKRLLSITFKIEGTILGSVVSNIHSDGFSWNQFYIVKMYHTPQLTVQ